MLFTPRAHSFHLGPGEVMVGPGGGRGLQRGGRRAATAARGPRASAAARLAACAAERGLSHSFVIGPTRIAVLLFVVGELALMGKRQQRPKSSVQDTMGLQANSPLY